MPKNTEKGIFPGKINPEIVEKILPRAEKGGTTRAEEKKSPPEEIFAEALKSESEAVKGITEKFQKIFEDARISFDDKEKLKGKNPQELREELKKNFEETNSLYRHIPELVNQLKERIDLAEIPKLKEAALSPEINIKG